VTHALAEPEHGMICGFRLAQPGVERLTAPDAAAHVWLHFNLSDTRARRWLEQRAPAPEAAREALAGDEVRLGLRLLPDAFVVVLADLHHQLGSDPDSFGEIRVYVDAERMITARPHPLCTTDRLRRELMGGAQFPSAMALFVRFIDGLADRFAGLVADAGERVDDAEEQVLAGRYADRGVALGRQRRMMVHLRRYLAADRAALAPLAARLPAAFDDQARVELRHTLDRLDAVAADLELVQERARLLQEEIAGRVGEATGRTLLLLSVVTTVLLPLTLIASLFGMNVELPWAHHPHAFWWILGLMVATLVAVLWWFRSRRLM
jgi:zinc transporter